MIICTFHYNFPFSLQQPTEVGVIWGDLKNGLESVRQRKACVQHWNGDVRQEAAEQTQQYWFKFFSFIPTFVNTIYNATLFIWDGNTQLESHSF